MNRWNTVASLAFLSSVLIACGGGNSFDGLPLPAEQQPGVDPGANEVPGSGSRPDPVNDQGGQEAPNSGGGQSGNGSQGGNGAEPEEQQMPGDVPVDMPGAVPLTVGDGSTARVLLSEDGPTIGVPGATIESISPIDGNDSGTLLIGGTYRTASNGTRQSAVWGGPYDNLSLLFQEFDRVPGQADNVRFSRANAVDVSSNGSFGMRATLSGAEENVVLLRRTIDATTWSLIVEEGDTLPGSPEPLSLTSLNRALFSDTGIAFSRGTIDSQNDILWVSDGAITRFVAAEERVVSAPPTFGAEACPIHLENHASSAFSSNSGNLFDISDQGVVVFEARVGPRFGNMGCQGRSIMRFDKGLYSSIVHEGQVVPNAPNSRFSDVYLIDVLPDGGAVVGARILTPTGGANPDSKSSLWLFPTQGAPSLVLLQGEEVQAGPNSFQIGPTAFRSAQTRRQLAIQLFQVRVHRILYSFNKPMAMLLWVFPVRVFSLKLPILPCSEGVPCSTVYFEMLRQGKFWTMRSGQLTSRAG